MCFGSSPLTRGKLLVAVVREALRVAHPRSRGENASAPEAISCGAGSSPLTRGKRLSAWSQCYLFGLIPAHAGKTTASRLSYLTGTAHPRSRGENFGLEEDSGLVDGSSPLTRGKCCHSETGLCVTGLIPAHAGKTPSPSSRTRWSAAHPRSRGENLAVPYGVEIELGSSPLTRGKLSFRFGFVRCGRLIPAHAGKTPSTRSLPSVAWAHPRSRGENGHGRGEPVNQAGSSPLTRGKRDAG